MDDSARQDNKKRGRTIRIFFPFLLLALFLTSIFMAQLWLRAKPVTGSTVTVPLLTGEMVADDQLTPVSATMLPPPTPLNATEMDLQSTLTTSATLPPGATIRLSGPPPGSSFYLDDSMSIYWSWPLELGADQQFVIYLSGDQTKHLAGVIQKPALGNHNYQLNFDPRDIVEVEGTYQIQVHLETKGAPAILAESTPRAVSLVLLPEL